MKIVTDKSTTLRIPMHISTDSLSEPQNSISSMENNQVNLETEPETQGLALEHSEILEDIAQIRGMAEEINQSLTETQWRQRLDAPASSIARNSSSKSQFRNGPEARNKFEIRNMFEIHIKLGNCPSDRKWYNRSHRDACTFTKPST